MKNRTARSIGSAIDAPLELGELFLGLERPPKTDQLAVDVVDHLGNTFRVFLQQHATRTKERLDVVRMRRHQGDDPLGEVMLAAVAFDGRGDRFVCEKRVHGVQGT